LRGAAAFGYHPHGAWLLKCVILQPSYIPWRGYFHQIQKADVFVFYDDVQYDDRGWRNRNRIKTERGVRWLTVPVRSRGNQVEGIPIKDIRIAWERAWADKHWATIRHSYGKAPFFKRYAPLVEAFYKRRDERLADLTIHMSIALAAELGIQSTRFLRSSSLLASGTRTDRLLSLLKAVGSDHYISGPSAREYIDQAKLDAARVTVEYMDYDYPQYEQLHPPYEARVSILDLLFMKGPESGRYIWGGA
jgi:hypothetical protein